MYHQWNVIATFNGVSATKVLITRNKALDAEFTNALWSAYGVRDKKDLDNLSVSSVTYTGTISSTAGLGTLIWAFINQISLAFID